MGQLWIIYLSNSSSPLEQTVFSVDSGFLGTSYSQIHVYMHACMVLYSQLQLLFLEICWNIGSSYAVALDSWHTTMPTGQLWLDTLLQDQAIAELDTLKQVASKLHVFVNPLSAGTILKMKSLWEVRPLNWPVVSASHVNLEFNLGTLRIIITCCFLMIYIPICAAWSEASPQNSIAPAISLIAESQWRLQDSEETIPGNFDSLPNKDSGEKLKNKNTPIIDLETKNPTTEPAKPAPPSPGSVSASSLPSSYASGSSVICLEFHIICTA